VRLEIDGREIERERERERRVEGTERERAKRGAWDSGLDPNRTGPNGN